MAVITQVCLLLMGRRIMKVQTNVMQQQGVQAHLAGVMKQEPAKALLKYVTIQQMMTMIQKLTVITQIALQTHTATLYATMVA